MINLSLARIMYGTNEDLHAPQAVVSAQYSALSAQSVNQNPSGGSSATTLGGLLHKAWFHLTHKG